MWLLQMTHGEYFVPWYIVFCGVLWNWYKIDFTISKGKC